MTNNNYKIDNHKLMYHPDRVSKWKNGEITYPIYAEISLTSACNHRCLFCAPNFFLNYEPHFIDTAVLKSTLTNMKKCGVKSIMYGGEGEPLLHKDIVSIINHTKLCGMDVSLTTNGVLLDSKIIDNILPNLSWIKISVDAGNSNDYTKLHGTKRSDFKKVLDNISRCSFMKRIRKYDMAIGVQSILFKENIEELPKLGKLLKFIKPDYFVVKPYSEHTKQLHKELHQPTDEQIEDFIVEMQKYRNDYEFIYRDTAFENMNQEKSYDKCYAQDFMAYIDSLGGVHSCINFIDDDKYLYGNIYKENFDDIWKNKTFIVPDLNKCRDICRMDKINNYLYEIKNPSKHVNFI